MPRVDLMATFSGRALPAPAYLRKICGDDALAERVAALPRPLVFTNGVFDLLHRGHVTYLARARALGASLLVALPVVDRWERRFPFAFPMVLVGLGLLLYFTPIMAARNVVVVGLGAVTQDEVTAAAAVQPGTPLLQVDTDAVAERVAAIRRVASARVQRQYPSTLRVTVIERIPVVVKAYPDGPHLFDKDGVDFATAPPPAGVPYLDADNPGPSDAPTKAALQVMTALRPEVAGQVGRVAAPSVAAITLTLIDGRTVVWGTTDRTEEKALKLGALLTQPGQTYDVSSPDLPTVK